MSPFQANQSLFDSALQELSQKYRMALEEAVHAACDVLCDEYPTPEHIAAHATLVKCRVGNDCYDEFQWDGRPVFRQRVVFETRGTFYPKVTIQITPC